MRKGQLQGEEREVGVEGESMEKVTWTHQRGHSDQKGMRVIFHFSCAPHPANDKQSRGLGEVKCD